MVDKKSPVKRQTVAKSTRAPRSKKLNLDKLITSIKNISTRYKRNGKMSGGNIKGFENVKTEIEKFFMTTTALNYSNTSFQNMLEDIIKIKGNNTSKDELLAKINTLITTPIDIDNPETAIGILLSAPYDIPSMLNSPIKKDRIGKRITFFYTYSNNPPVLIMPVQNIFKDSTTNISDPLLKKALSYISLVQIATTLAIIYNFIDNSS
jgi:hypothetical protein